MQFELIKETTSDGKIIELCPNCRQPVGPAFGAMGPDNRFYRIRKCQPCNITFERKGPFQTMKDAAPL